MIYELPSHGVSRALTKEEMARKVPEVTTRQLN